MTSLVILLKVDLNHWFFSPCDHNIFWVTSKNNRAPLLYYSSFEHHFKAIGEFTLQLQSENVQFGSKSVIFYPVWLEIWWMTLDNNSAPLLYYLKLCASYQSHWWIQTWVTVWKRSILVKIVNLLSNVTLKFDGWPWKTIGHLFYTTPSSVHYFKAIGKLKLELQSGNAQFGQNQWFFCAVWHWNLKDNIEKQ